MKHLKMFCQGKWWPYHTLPTQCHAEDNPSDTMRDGSPCHLCVCWRPYVFIVVVWRQCVSVHRGHSHSAQSASSLAKCWSADHRVLIQNFPQELNHSLPHGQANPAPCSDLLPRIHGLLHPMTPQEFPWLTISWSGPMGRGIGQRLLSYAGL